MAKLMAELESLQKQQQEATRIHLLEFQPCGCKCRLHLVAPISSGSNIVYLRSDAQTPFQRGPGQSQRLSGWFILVAMEGSWGDVGQPFTVYL